MSSTPMHVGIIMDGNRRWAVEHGVSTAEGHRAGYQTLKALLPVFKRSKVEYLTVFAFSTENWSRSVSEVRGIMSLLKWVFKNELKTFMEEDIKIRVIGSKQNLPPGVLDILDNAEQKTAQNKSGTLGVCFNYGGKQEITDAVRAIVQERVSVGDVSEELIAKHLYAPDIPPLDFIIRTSNEHRLSNFMLWRSDYAELYFIDKHWPDVTEEDFENALSEYSKRQRRFGS